MSVARKTTSADERQTILRLWAGQAADGSGGDSSGDAPADDGDGLSENARMSEFFYNWFLPIVLESQREAARATIALYKDAVEWWKLLTADPPLALVNDFTIKAFKDGLKSATFKRGPMAACRTMSAFTQARHLRSVRAILHRAGPNHDPRRPSLALIERVPYVPVGKPSLANPKSPFLLDEARAIAAATSRMAWPRRWKLYPQPKTPADRWWLGLEEGLYFTPLRVGTVLDLEWSMLADRADGAWLKVPAEIVHKTGKPVEQFVHPALRAAWERLRPYSRDGKILGRPYAYDSISRLHEKLCELAGLPEERRLSPHAWRRTHADQIARVGFDSALELARRSLDHADAATTSAHYADLVSMAIRRLPLLRPEAVE